MQREIRVGIEQSSEICGCTMQSQKIWNRAWRRFAYFGPDGPAFRGATALSHELDCAIELPKALLEMLHTVCESSRMKPGCPILRRRLKHICFGQVLQ